jgi:hypothetical protein
MRGKLLLLQVIKFHNDIGCNWCSVVHELWNVAHSTQAIIAHSTGQPMHNHDGSSSGHKMKPSFRAQKLETDCPSLFSWSPVVARNPVHDVVPERVLEPGPFGAPEVSRTQLARCSQYSFAGGICNRLCHKACCISLVAPRSVFVSSVAKLLSLNIDVFEPACRPAPSPQKQTNAFPGHL